MKFTKLAAISITALTLSAVYLYAWPTPNLFYAAAVLFHTGLGVLFCIGGLRLLPHALRQPLWVKLGSLLLAVGAAIGLALIYTGTSRPHWNLLYTHIVISVLAVVLLAAWWWSHRDGPPAQLVGRGPGSSGGRGGGIRWSAV